MFRNLHYIRVVEKQLEDIKVVQKQVYESSASSEEHLEQQRAIFTWKHCGILTVGQGGEKWGWRWNLPKTCRKD